MAGYIVGSIIVLAIVLVQCSARSLDRDGDGVLLQRLKRSYRCDSPIDQPYWPPPPPPPPPPSPPPPLPENYWRFPIHPPPPSPLENYWPPIHPTPPPPPPIDWDPPHHHQHHHHEIGSDHKLEKLIDSNNGLLCDDCNKNAVLSNSYSVNGNAIAVAISRSNGK